jgi:alpha-beta hydrolase superfamily lysophospholipase
MQDTGSARRAPILFVHGSYHSAWCYAEHFMPYFAALGYDAYAVSLRAQVRVLSAGCVSLGCVVVCACTVSRVPWLSCM